MIVVDPMARSLWEVSGNKVGWSNWTFLGNLSKYVLIFFVKISRNL